MFAGQPGMLQPQGDVALDGHVRPQGVALEDQAEIAIFRRYQHALFTREDQPIGQVDFPTIGLFEAGDKTKRGGLAAARGAENREKIPWLHQEVHVFHGNFLAVCLADPGESNVFHQPTARFPG